MIFDQPPAELPVATLRPHDTGSQLLLDLRGWFAARWRWLKPRAIPVAVAFAGMLGVLASASYLRDLRPPEQLPRPLLVRTHTDDPVARDRTDARPQAAGTCPHRRAAWRVRAEPTAPATAPLPPRTRTPR